MKNKTRKGAFQKAVHNTLTTLFLILIAAGACFSQTKKYVSFQNDLKKGRDGETYVIDAKKQLKDGSDANVEVSIVCLLGKTEPDEKAINNAIDLGYIGAKYQCKSKSTYRPKKIAVYLRGYGYEVAVDFTCKNAYGVPQDAYASFKADSEGMMIVD